MKCVVVGATNLDMTLNLEAALRLKDKNPVSVHESFGGVGYNIALGLSKWVPEVHFMTAFEGQIDPLVKTFKALTILPVSPQPRFIGVMQGEKVEVAFSAMEALDTFSCEAFKNPLSQLDPDDIVVFDLNFPVEEVIDLIKSTPAKVFIEATSAHKIEKLRTFNLPLYGLKLNQLEAEVLTEETSLEAITKNLESRPIQTIILTLGALGVMVFNQGTWTHSKDTHPWKSINDSGIGDAFMAGYIAGLLRDEEPLLNAFTMSYITAQFEEATAFDVELNTLIQERKNHHVDVISRRPRST
jgi:sugar/nucleoside kinase (ribokinase family)